MKRVLYFFESTAESSSFVVVFPFVPVIWITGMEKVFRWNLASCCRARRASSTRMYLSSLEGTTSLLSTTAIAHPLSNAVLAYMLPSNFSPFRAKNMEPSGQFLLSVVISGCFRKTLCNCSIFIVDIPVFMLLILLNGLYKCKVIKNPKIKLVVSLVFACFFVTLKRII